MPSQKIEFSFHPSDLWAYIVLIIGILFVVFFNETILVLLGGGFIVLGLLSVGVLLKQRSEQEIGFGKMSSSSNYANARPIRKSETRSLDEDDYNVKSEDKDKPNKSDTQKLDDNIVFEDQNEGFRVVAKPETNKNTRSGSNHSQENREKTIPLQSKKSESIGISDEGFRIIDSKDKQTSSETNDFGRKKIISKSGTITKPKLIKSNEVQTLNWDALIDSEIFPANQPKKELDYFLKRILGVIKSEGTVNTAVFFLYDEDSGILKIEAYNSENDGQINKKKKYTLRSDFVSRIVENAKPITFNELQEDNPDHRLIYYSNQGLIGSFIGVPVVLSGSVIGVIAVDSKETNAFGESFALTLSYLSGLISGLIQSYTEKFELMQMAESYTAISTFRSISSEKSASIEDISMNLLRTVNSSLEPNSLGTVLYDHESETWKAFHVISVDENNLSGAKLEGESVFTDCIRTQKPLYFANKSKIRFNEKAELKLSKGSELHIIPLYTNKSVYGAMFVVLPEGSQVGEYGIGVMETLSEYAAIAIEKIYLSQIISSNSLYDPISGLLNEAAFSTRIDEEEARAYDHEYISTLVLIKIDEYEAHGSLEENRGLIGKSIADLLAQSVRLYDVVGHAKGKTGALLVNVDLSESKVWAEKLKNKIATSSINIAGEEINFTISVSIIQIGDQEPIGSDKVLEKSLLALDNIAEQHNTVATYS
ncbi:MAG: hypothetical protein Kapaf2KO_04210 [Candidatus Kapaibacteriales bacterium]